jgi:putative membrane protein
MARAEHKTVPSVRTVSPKGKQERNASPMTSRSVAFQWTKVSIFALAMALMLGLALAAAQQPGSLSAEDRKFVVEVAQGTLAEVELGKVAVLRGSSDKVKQFGQRMVADHGKAGDDLTQLARQKGVTLSKELDNKHQQLRDRLAKLSGADFDRAYMNEMVKDHRKDVAVFKKHMQTSKDLELKVWAGTMLPTLEEHLRLAENLAARAKGGATK